MSPIPEPLSQAADLLRSGDKDQARQLLSSFLRENPNSARAWWLMSYAVDDPAQKIDSLKRVLVLVPNHRKAEFRLAELTGETRHVPIVKSVRKPAHKSTPRRKKTSVPLPAIIILAVFGCLGFLAVGYFGYQIFFSSPGAQPTLAVIAEVPTQAVTAPMSKLPPTWTPTPTLSPTVTPTPPPDATSTPLFSNTPTPDPNATSTPIPDNKIGTSVGQYPPDFALVDAITGEEVSLSDFSGKPVLILFFTTWCSSCSIEMPDVQAMYEKYYDQGFVVIGVGIGASRSALRNYAGRYDINFLILSDWEHQIARDYGVQYIPTNFFIRKNGKIWKNSVGMMSEDELDNSISSILKVP
jgi:peroxiredoxin